MSLRLLKEAGGNRQEQTAVRLGGFAEYYLNYRLKRAIRFYLQDLAAAACHFFVYPS